MPVLLAYNITTESPQKSPSRTLQYPVTPVPSPPRPLSPSPPPPPPLLLPASEAVPIPLPCGRKITHAPTEDILDAETRFNTEFNTRRSAATTTTASSAGAPTVSSKARKGRRVGFKRELVTFIPPPCWDLVLYGQRCGDDNDDDDDGSAGKRMGRWWWWTERALALVLAAVLAVGLVECGWWGIARAPSVVLGHSISGQTYI